MKAYITKREPKKRIIGYISQDGHHVWLRARSGNCIFFNNDGGAPCETIKLFDDLEGTKSMQPIYEGDEILIQF